MHWKYPAGLLGGAPEKRRTWVLAVQIGHDREGFVEREIAIAECGGATERIDGEELRGFKLAL